MKNSVLFPQNADGIVSLILKVAALVATSVVGLILIFLTLEIANNAEVVSIGRYFSDRSWHPTENLFNLTPMITGTMLLAIGAIALGLPLALGVCTYLHMYCPRGATTPIRRIVELMAGIPSVVYGFWGLVVVVPTIASVKPPGASLAAGTLILAMMILPTLVLLIDTTFAAADRGVTKGIGALGLGRYEVMTLHLLPQSKLGIFTATILATGRAIGETMAVLMVCGNIVQVPGSIFEPVRSLTANIALELGYAEGMHRQSLFMSGIMLMLVIVLLIGLSMYLERRWSDDDQCASTR